MSGHWKGIHGSLTIASNDSNGKLAMFIGAGGTSRAAVYALSQQLDCLTIYVVVPVLNLGQNVYS